MIELRKEQMVNAIQKAKTHRCHVKPLAWRRYQVTTPEGKTYLVNFDVQNGRKLAQCGCKAGENERVCYHVAASCAVHCAIAKMKAEAEPLCLPDAEPVKRELTDAEIDAEWDRVAGPRPPAKSVFDSDAFLQATGKPALPPAARRLTSENIAQAVRDAHKTCPTFRQKMYIKALERDRGLDAEAVCQDFYGCSVDQLDHTSARGLIAKLKTHVTHAATWPQQTARIVGIER